jgi:hypothetical protein
MALVGTILLVVIIFGLTAIYYNAYGQQLEKQLIQREPHDLTIYRHEQRQLLEGEPRWVSEQVDDEEVRRYVIPIDRAMDIMAQDAQR